MRRKTIWLSVLLVATAALGAARPHSPHGLIVHEWGTFLSMNGSDGVTLDGMYHEEHALPDFVHSRSKDQLHLHSSSLKGETPVIYFYTDQAQQATVRVRFPQGVWTQWYPQADLVGPSLTQLGGHLQPRNGMIKWETEIVPAEDRDREFLPRTAADALWNYARDVDAAYVRTARNGEDARGGRQQEWERFLFYRGLGRANLPLGLTYDQGGTLSLSAGGQVLLKHLFVMRVENGKGAYRYISALEPGQSLTKVLPAMDRAEPLSAFSKKIGDDLAEKLTDSGLYPKEARAMVNTWRTSYFQNEGIRVLYVLPQEWTDRFIPLEISPRPQKIVRVMVGRTELLSPEREKKIEGAVRDLTAPDAADRESAFTYLREQGRYVEPILRRTLRTTQDPKVRTLCSRLLLTDFVNELRSAVHAADSGVRLTDSPARIRAQFSSLLREIGQDAEARAEAQAALEDLQHEQSPKMNESESRHYFRAYARAMEGLGDEGRAAEGYRRFIQFASQVKSGCATCHSGVTAPRDMAWFRDWYAGKKFAAYTLRTGQADSAITEAESTLHVHPNDVAAQMRLAYLYEARGKRQNAATLWAQMDASRPDKIAAQ
jgi:tetratricopeptide (TPR) repeat protein